MKGSKVLIIGGLVVTGVIAYELYKHYHFAKNTCEANSKDEDIIFHKQDKASVNSSVTPTSDILETKETAVASIKERHYEAAKVMEESLNTIFKEDDGKNIASVNSDTLIKTSSTLNDMLK